MKRLLILTLCAIMLLSLAACRGTQTASTDPTPEPKTEAPVMTAEPTEVPTEAPTDEPTAVPTEAPTPAPYIPDTALLTEVLRVSIGNADDQFGIDMSVEGNVPEAFSVFDDSIAVLDSVKQRVCVYEDGALARTIDLTKAHAMIYGYSMARLGSRLFVHDAYSDIVFEFDFFSGEIKNSYAVPEELCENDSCSLFEIDGGVYVGALRSGRFILKNLLETDASAVIWEKETADNESFIWSTPFSSANNRLDRDENRFYYFINSDAEGNAYFEVCDLIPDMGDYICPEVYLIKCSPDGDIVGYAGFQNELEIKLPHRHTLVLEDGRVFEMMCTETEIVIYEVTFGSTYNCRLDELREYYRNKFGLD